MSYRRERCEICGWRLRPKESYGCTDCLTELRQGVFEWRAEHLAAGSEAGARAATELADLVRRHHAGERA